MEEGSLPGREQLDDDSRVEAAHDRDRPACRQDRERLPVQAGHVEHGDRDDRRLSRFEVETADPCLRGAHQVKVRLERPLRVSSRA